MANGIYQWQILKKYGNILNICLFGQFTKQLLSNFEPWQVQKHKQFWGLGCDPNFL